LGRRPANAGQESVKVIEGKTSWTVTDVRARYLAGGEGAAHRRGTAGKIGADRRNEEKGGVGVNEGTNYLTRVEFVTIQKRCQALRKRRQAENGRGDNSRAERSLEKELSPAKNLVYQTGFV